MQITLVIIMIEINIINTFNKLQLHKELSSYVFTSDIFTFL